MKQVNDKFDNTLLDNKIENLYELLKKTNKAVSGLFNNINNDNYDQLNNKIDDLENKFKCLDEVLSEKTNKYDDSFINF